MRHVLTSLVIAGIVVSFSASLCRGQERYRRASIDSGGQLRLVTAAGGSIVPPRDSDQIGFDRVAISRDHRRVGWLAMYPNCCTSYPIPLKLVVQSHGKDKAFDGNGLPIWQWAFLDGGKRVAYRQAPVHGSLPAHYELHDVETGRLVSAFDMTAKSGAVPRWARTVSTPNDSPNHE